MNTRFHDSLRLALGILLLAALAGCGSTLPLSSTSADLLDRPFLTSHHPVRR